MGQPKSCLPYNEHWQTFNPTIPGIAGVRRDLRHLEQRAGLQPVARADGGEGLKRLAGVGAEAGVGLH
jgi:hypothetical protein